MPVDLTLYERLEVSPTDSEHDIKKAGRKMALRWHPDKNLDCQEEATIKFKEVQEAVDILTDPQRRRNYDQFGFSNTNNTPNPFPFPTHFPFPPFPFGMPPGMMPPGMEIRINGINNDNVRHTLTVKLPIPENVTFSYKRDITCQNCVCQKCNGKGMNLTVQQMGIITIQHQTPCVECNAKRYNDQECIRCNQTRRISTEHTMTLNIQHTQNIQNQTIQINIPNQGHQLCSGNTNLIIDMKFV
jgi:DnaJ-class molecular chaperone